MKTKHYDFRHVIVLLAAALITILAFCSTAKAATYAGETKNTQLPKAQLQYDDKDRLTAISGPGDRRIAIQYDDRGQLSFIKNNEGEEFYEYDRRGFLKSVKDSTGTTLFRTDAFGRLKSMTYPSGEEVTYEYTDSGSLAAVAWGDKHMLRFIRDLLGNPVVIETPVGNFDLIYDYNKRFLQRKYPNGAFSQFTFNREGRPTLITHAGPDRRVFLQFKYDYGDAGRLQAASELTPNGKVNITYTYDAYGQLLKAEYSDGRVYSYTYDLFGNILNITAPERAINMTYGTSEQLEHINKQPVEHDAAGNTSSLDGKVFAYDSANALINDGTYSYQYNALGLRVTTSDAKGTTQFIHLIDDLPYVFAETGTATKRYLWSDGQILGQIEDDGQALFFFEDHLGSVRAAMDRQGNIVGYAEFTPYGIPIKRIPRVRFGFASEEQNSEGRLYLRARYYQPHIGRFLSSDPLLPLLMEQAKQNQYAYAGNSPLNFRDRNGHQKEQFFKPYLFFDHLSISDAPIYAAPGEELNWTDDPAFIENIISDYNHYYDDYLNNNYSGVKELTVDQIKEARRYAFREFSKSNALYPKGWQEFLVARGDLIKGQPNRVLPANTVTPSNLGLINWDWQTTVGHHVTVFRKGNDNMFDAYMWAKPKWNTYKAASRWGNFLMESLLYVIYPKDRNRLVNLASHALFDKEEMAPPQDVLGILSGSMLQSGEITPEHLLKPQYKNDLKEFINHRQGDRSGFLPLHKKLPKRAPQSTPTKEDDEWNNDKPIQENLQQHTKALTEHIISQLQVMEGIIGKYDISGGPGRVAGPGGYASPGAEAAVAAFNEMRASSTPNVGGVYLAKAAEAIGQIANIEGATFDPESNRLILIGSDAGTSSLSPARLDDLAAAFHSVLGDFQNEPGVTIDPNPENPHADQMIVRFFGGMENTHFGYSLFEADRVMKSLSLGQDNITHQPVNVKVKDYYNMLDLGFSNLGGPHQQDLWSRFWLVPEQVIVKLSDDKKSITFPDTRIRVKTETMRWKNGKLVPARNERDEKAEYFAAHFTKFYDQYAEEFPIFRELKNLANLVGIAKWLKESGLPVDLSWLDTYLNPYETPTHTPSHTVSDQRPLQPGKITQISVFGGTDLTVENTYVKGDGTSSEYSRKAIHAIADTPGVAQGDFITSDKQQKKVLALPTSQMRAPGANILVGRELTLLPRAFCSFHNDVGPFGHSWIFDLPELQITQSHRGKREYVSTDSQKVMVQSFHLTRPFGLFDITFKKHAIDQQSGRIAFLPERLAGIRALYPEPEIGAYRVEYEEGQFEVYNSRGKLIERHLTSTVSQRYSYDAAARLTGVQLIDDETVIAEVALSYDNAGRVVSAVVPEGSVQYSYDADGNLVRVVTEDNIVEYAYDDRHLVTRINRNGEELSAFNYDDYGRIETWKASGSEYSTEHETVGTYTLVKQRIGENEISRKYDLGGRLLEVRLPSGAEIKADYHELGALKSIISRNESGDTVQLDYSPDNRYVQSTDPEGNVTAFLFDELGRLKQVQNGNATMINKEYGQTTQGWLESTETSELIFQALFDKNEKPIDHIITAKNPRGGQLHTRYEYTPQGQLRRETTEGLLAADRLYQNGKLIKQSQGVDETSYAYDAKNQLEKIISGKDTIELFRDNEGTIETIAMHRGSFKEVFQLKNGLLEKRTTGEGIVDTFQYDDTGGLVGVKRGDGESWDIKRQENSVSVLRNGSLQMRFIFDDRGRLQEMSY